MTNLITIEKAIEFLYLNIHISSATLNFFNVAYFLGSSKDERAFDPLIEALHKGGAYMKATSAIGLGMFGDSKAIPHLTQALLFDQGIYVRGDAALALGMIKSEDSLPLLVQQFYKEIFEVQKRIIISLNRMNTNSAKSKLQEIKEYLHKQNQNTNTLVLLNSIKCDMEDCGHLEEANTP